MASFLDKFQIKTAAPAKQKFDLSCQHITTADFMQLCPSYVKEMIPNENLSVNMQTFSRMSAMDVPTFGRANIHNKAFFVPYRTIFKGWNDFITDTVHVNANGGDSILNRVPAIYMSDLTDVLFSYTGTDNTKGVFGTITYDTAIDPDVVYDMDDNTGSSHRVIIFNAAGRQALKVLNSLGYTIMPTTEQTVGSTLVSALPLLAYAKVYVDWYWPSAWYDDAERISIQKLFERDNYITNSPTLTVGNLRDLLSVIIRVNYDSDYFTSAFQNPVGPSTGAFSSGDNYIAIPDPTNDTTWENGRFSPSVSDNGTPIMHAVVGSVANQRESSLTQYALDALKALTDYMKRHQLVGARALDRYMARFGINLKSDKLDRSIYIGSQSIPLQIGDVMSQSSTDGAKLGDYAGKGLAYGGSNFDFETEEYGMFIILTSIVPTVGYYQGIDRTCLHLTKLDFFTPEFDQLGTQAISAAELYINQTTSDDRASQDGPTSTFGQIFGWTPRYSEYKIGRDRLTGDYRIPSKSVAGDTSSAWHLMRQFDSSQFGDKLENVVISKDFVQGADATQYDRIFQNVTDSADHFYLVHNFDVASYAPMKRLYDTYEFDSDGKDVIMDVNGVKVN